MNSEHRDIWSEYLLDRRFGGNRELMKEAIDDYYYPVRNQVLQNARLGDHEVLLDVGCGDGLIAFGALDKSSTSTVIFSDISQKLLNHDQLIAQKMNLTGRSHFLLAAAEASAVRTSSVDVVTVSGVLIHVAAKQSAFNEFFRVLKPGGRLSIFEPINSFSLKEPAYLFSGFDVTPITEIAAKLKKAIYQRQPPSNDPMLNFDERNLVEFAETAGFGSVHLDFQIKIAQPKVSDWEALFRAAPNPRALTLEETIKEALTPEEGKIFVTHIRPLVESRRGIKKHAVAYLSAIKS